MRTGIVEEAAAAENSTMTMINGRRRAMTSNHDTGDDNSNDNVISALSQTKKGQLKYDTQWKEEGRTEVRAG